MGHADTPRIKPLRLAAAAANFRGGMRQMPGQPGREGSARRDTMGDEAGGAFCDLPGTGMAEPLVGTDVMLGGQAMRCQHSGRPPRIRMPGAVAGAPPVLIQCA